VDHDLDSLELEAEEEMRLDQLQALVHERRRVDRDLRAHVPGRVCKRFGRRDVGELASTTSTKGTPRGGEDERVDRFLGPAFEALEPGRMLAVNGQDPPSAPLLGGERERPGCNEALLVRQREVDAALERLQRRREACESHDGVQDDVWLARPDELVKGWVAADRHVLDAVLACDPLRLVRLRSDGDRAQLELGVGGDHLERLCADRACGAE
jgi:hypothetical protein